MSEKTTKSATLARWRERKKKPQAAAISRKPAGAPAPLSYGQQRLWFLQELYPENPFYNYAETYRLRGNLNVENLLKGLEYVARRHDILRTTFEANGEQAIQIIHDEPRFDIQKYDLQNQTNQTENIQKITEQTAREPFDLQNGALTRIALIQLAENDYLLVLAMHHIIGDRWSIELLQADWAKAFLQNGESLPKNSLQIQYADYAYWQKRQAPYSEAALNYWKQKLSGELPVLTLPTDYSEPVKLVLRSDLSENPRFTDLLNDVRQTVLDAFSHRNMPFETLVKTLQPERRTSANPLFRVMFLYYDVAEVPKFSSDLTLTHEPYDLGVAKFDLTLFIANKNGQLTTDLFSPETIERMHTHLQVLLQGIITNLNQKIAQLPLLSETEKQTILYDWNTSTPPLGGGWGEENSKSSDILKMSDYSAHPDPKGSQPTTLDTRNNGVGWAEVLL